MSIPYLCPRLITFRYTLTSIVLSQSASLPVTCLFLQFSSLKTTASLVFAGRSCSSSNSKCETCAIAPVTEHGGPVNAQSFETKNKIVKIQAERKETRPIDADSLEKVVEKIIDQQGEGWQECAVIVCCEGPQDWLENTDEGHVLALFGGRKGMTMIVDRLNDLTGPLLEAKKARLGEPMEDWVEMREAEFALEARG